MASSSVSQESLDLDDFENSTRRNRIRVHRGRGMAHRVPDREASPDQDQQNGESGDRDPSLIGHVGQGDHDSPTRSNTGRAKDKRSRPNHFNKGKMMKEKRKLREKRRSTGVVHLPSTESTGDSLDDDDDDDNSEKSSLETKRNTALNETVSANNEPNYHHASHSHGHSSVLSFAARRNKSPSDLEADLEDNQDYDSTVSHSETNLTLIGRSESSDTQMAPNSRGRGGLVSRLASKYSPQEPCKPLSVAASASNPSDPDPLSTSNQPFSSTTFSTNPNNASPSPSSSSSSSSVLFRYREREAPSRRVEPEPAPKEPEPSRRPYGLSGVRDNRGEATYSSYLAARNRSRDHGSTVPSIYSRLNYPGPKPFGAQGNNDTSELEKLLEKERDENRRLQQLVEEKDRRITELERQVSLMTQDIHILDQENMKLQDENSVLIRAMSQLSTKV